MTDENTAYLKDLLARIDQALSSDTLDESVLDEWHELVDDLSELDDPDIWRRHSLVLVELGDFEGAIEAINHSVRLSPDSNGWAIKGHILHELGELQEASAAYRQALEGPDVWEPADTWRSLGELLMEMDDIDGARTAIEAAVEINDRDVDSWWLLGLVRDAADDEQGAAAAFERGLGLARDEPLLYYSRAQVHARRGRKEAALEDLAAALSLDPDLRQDMREEASFDTLRGLDLFKRLVGSS